MLIGQPRRDDRTIMLDVKNKIEHASLSVGMLKSIPEGESFFVPYGTQKQLSWKCACLFPPNPLPVQAFLVV